MRVSFIEAIRFHKTQANFLVMRVKGLRVIKLILITILMGGYHAEGFF